MEEKKTEQMRIELKTQDYNRNFNKPLLLMDNIRWSRPAKHRQATRSHRVLGAQLKDNKRSCTSIV